MPIIQQAKNATANNGPLNEPLLAVNDLQVVFGESDTAATAVDGVSFEVFPGETLGIVGESGSGKSVTVMSLLGLIPEPPGKVVDGTAMYAGHDLLQMSQEHLRGVRGKEIGMVFQDAMTALNPVLTVGFQITEALKVHQTLSPKLANSRAVDLLQSVGVPNATTRLQQYPHEYSGGMRQRAMIAMAIANRPRLLIADEPTTALDVTTQAQVLDVLQRAKNESGAATILITHDLAVVAEMADRVLVMYSGQVVEAGTVEQIFNAPSHPYTVGLLRSLPRLDGKLDRLLPIAGNAPSASDLPSGCRFHPRCDMSAGRSLCVEQTPDLLEAGDGAKSRCHFREEVPIHRTLASSDMSKTSGE